MAYLLRHLGTAARLDASGLGTLDFRSGNPFGALTAAGQALASFVGQNSGDDPRVLPPADFTATMGSWTESALVSAFSAEATYHASNPTNIYRINAPTGTPSFNLGANRTFVPAGPTILDQKSCTIVQNGAHTVTFAGHNATADLVWKKAATIGTAGGKTTAVPLSGSWPTTPVAGDVCRIASKHRFFGDDSYTQAYMGELMLVESYNAGSKLITFTEFAFRQDGNAEVGGPAYGAADNPHVCMMDRSAQFWLKDFKMTGASTQATILLQLKTLYKPRIIHPFLDTCANNFIYAIGNYGGYVTDPHIEDGAFSGSELTYGFNMQGNKDFTILSNNSVVNITRTRNPADANIAHIGTGLDPATASLSQLAQWGPDIHTVRDGLNIEDMKSNGSSTHSGAVRSVWRNIIFTRTGTVPLGDTAPMMGAPRGKFIEFDNWRGKHTSGIQFFAYDADPSAPAASAPRDGEYRDSSDVYIHDCVYEITGPTTGNGWMFCSPTAGATLDGELVKYARFDGLRHNNNDVTLSGPKARAFLPLCGSMECLGNTLRLKAKLNGALYTLTRPSATIIGDDTVLTVDETLDLTDYAVGNGTITYVSCGANSFMNGTLTVTNNPGVSVVKSGAGAAGLTIIGG